MFWFLNHGSPMQALLRFLLTVLALVLAACGIVAPAVLALVHFVIFPAWLSTATQKQEKAWEAHVVRQRINLTVYIGVPVADTQSAMWNVYYRSEAQLLEQLRRFARVKLGLTTAVLLLALWGVARTDFAELGVNWHGLYLIAAVAAVLWVAAQMRRLLQVLAGIQTGRVAIDRLSAEGVPFVGAYTEGRVGGEIRVRPYLQLIMG